jgi:hypothetical protein
MHPSHHLRGQHAVKLYLSTDLKARINTVAESLDRPFAEVCRHLMWMALPILEGMQDAQQRGTRWWLNSIGRDPGEAKEILEETA